jgi:hypothetical protein
MCGLNAGEACRAGRVVVAWALSESRRGYVFSIAPTITEFSFVSVGLLACLKVNLTPFHANAGWPVNGALKQRHIFVTSPSIPGPV